MTPLETALGYRSLGLVVIPLLRGFKLPRDKAWQREPRQDEARVRELFAEHDGGVGIVTGSVSRLVVLDVDVKKGGKGYECLAAWEAAHGLLPPTFTVATPSGGEHRYYRLPEGRRVQTHKLALVDGIAKVAGGKTHADVDVMGDNATGGGRQIAAPPTVLSGDLDPTGKIQIPGPYSVKVVAPIADWPADMLPLLPEAKPAEAPAAAVVDWKPVAADDPTYDRRAAFQRSEFAKVPLLRTGESEIGVMRYVLMLRRLGPGLLLDRETTRLNYAECYDPRLPAEDRWLPDCQDEFLRGPLRRAYETQPDKGARPDQTWREEGQFFEPAQQPADTSPIPSPTDESGDEGLGFEYGCWTIEPPPTEFLVDGLLPRGCVGMFFGRADALKTWLLFSLGLAVAGGRPWLGHHHVPKAAKVGIVDFETGKANVDRRLFMLGAGGTKNLGRKSFAKLKPNDPNFWLALAREGFDLVIVDSLRKANPGADENDSKESIKPLEFAAEFSEATGCAVLFIHHAKKDSADGWPEFRGSGAIEDQVDVSFAVKKTDVTAEKKLVEIRCVKPGDMRTPGDFAVEVSFDDKSRKVSLQRGEPKPEEEPSKYDNSAKAIQILRGHSAGVPKQDLLNMLQGKTDARRADLSSLLLSGVVVEYNERKKVFVMLNPSAAGEGR